MSSEEFPLSPSSSVDAIGSPESSSSTVTPGALDYSPSRPLSASSLIMDTVSPAVTVNDDRIKIPQLAPGMFSNWNKRLHFALKTRGLLSHLTSDVAPTNPAELDAWERNQGRVLELILNSVDATNESLIDLTDTPKAAYDKLAKAHGSSGGVLAAAAICDIATARLEAGQSLSDFITRVRNLHGQLAQYATEDKDITLSPKLLATFERFGSRLRLYYCPILRRFIYLNCRKSHGSTCLGSR